MTGGLSRIRRSGLNEVQFPKELQQVGVVARVGLVVASMKCSS